MSKYSIIPDWTSPKELVLIYPQHLTANHERTNRDTLIYFFHTFLEVLNKTNSYLKINIICQREFSLKLIENRKNLFPYSNLDITFSEVKVQDIWIRDWAPIPVKINNINTSIRTNYSPSYCLYPQLLENQASKILQIKYSSNLDNIKLNWEIGNLVTNGNILIVTNKILEENPSLTKQQIIDLLKQTFEITKVIFIPVEPLDKIGHSDGIVRFITPNHLVLPSYPNTYIEERKYIDEVISNLIDGLEEEKDSYSITMLPSTLSEYKNKEDIYSAVGCYVNYFRIANNIYIPQYNLKQDKEVLSILSDTFPHLNLIPIPNCNRLADLGGVLNCMTWLNF